MSAGTRGDVVRDIHMHLGVLTWSIGERDGVLRGVNVHAHATYTHRYAHIYTQRQRVTDTTHTTVNYSVTSHRISNTAYY